jgi:peptidyl-prolyl cis-trans isomerase D
MLNALRKQAGSWVVKALLLILVLSFAIWGVGDIFYGNPQQATVAEVGDAEITANELNDAFNRQVDNLQRQFGGQLTREQAISFGLMQQTLQELVDQRMVDQETQKLGITVADDTLRDLIVENPAFQSAGRFDRLRFQQLLATTGLSEDGYLEVLRQDLARSTLTGSMLAPVTVPEILVERLYGYRNEARRGRVLKVLSAGIDDLPEPGEDELETLYESDEARFTAPEYRSIDYVALTPEQLLDEIEVPFDEVQAAYDARAAQYRSPERREVEQLLIQDEAVVEEAKALIAEGKSFEEVAEALQDQGVSRTDLGNVTAADMPAGLGEAAFAVPEGEVSDVVESPFGKHLFHIAAVTPEEVTPIGEVQNEIERELALEQAADRLPDLAAQLDDELAAGSSVEDAAAALGIDSQTATLVDRQGQNQEGERDPDLPPWPELLATAFDAPVDQPGLLE